ncbi:hypothetical protein K2X89_07685 [Myxococcota bacterium]|nr:hypothetical protein [Myxococcota bacterium]
MASRSIRRATPSGVLAGYAPASSRGIARGLVALGEAVAYSSGLAALVGGAMTWAAGRALLSPSAPRDAALVACGAFVVYNVDRLRDLAQDRSSSPSRSAFVLRRRRALLWATAAASLALIALLATSSLPDIALCLAVGAIGLLHRRLKHDVRFKIAYVAAAWTAACVGVAGLGAIEAGGDFEGVAGAFAWSLFFVGSGVTANLIASNLRDGKRLAAGWTRDEALPLARAVAIAGLAAAAIAPERVALLAWIPAAEALALVAFRGSERFGHLAVDGALLAGALFAMGCAGN